MRALIIGATGFVGRRLATRLLKADAEVACSVRSAESDVARELRDRGCKLHPGDLTEPSSLVSALTGIDVVYYLAHLMTGGDDDLVDAEEAAAAGLAAAAREAGVERVVYLGGLGDPSVSEHLWARHRTAEVLAADGPPLTYFRAAMVVGSGSDSYELLRSLVDRLPAIFEPEWLANETQPIDIDAVVEYLIAAPGVEAAANRTIEIGGSDRLTYGGMLERMAAMLGKDAPRSLPTPAGISAKAAGRIAGGVTTGDPAVARQITAGLETPTVVEDPSGMELFDVKATSYERALARAIDDGFRADDAAREKAARS